MFYHNNHIIILLYYFWKYVMSGTHFDYPSRSYLRVWQVSWSEWKSIRFTSRSILWSTGKRSLIRNRKWKWWKISRCSELYLWKQLDTKVKLKWICGYGRHGQHGSYGGHGRQGEHSWHGRYSPQGRHGGYGGHCGHNDYGGHSANGAYIKYDGKCTHVGHAGHYG